MLGGGIGLDAYNWTHFGLDANVTHGPHTQLDGSRGLLATFLFRRSADGELGGFVRMPYQQPINVGSVGNLGALTVKLDGRDAITLLQVGRFKRRVAGESPGVRLACARRG